jgi:hypothetical protein
MVIADLFTVRRPESRRSADRQPPECVDNRHPLRAALLIDQRRLVLNRSDRRTGTSAIAGEIATTAWKRTRWCQEKIHGQRKSTVCR